ncbi:TetR family transcriptional regulator, partial [Nocardia brasiliensis]|uniref:TetR family transcriptional regulator n=1 Tax=Nocardia brasiliensis TaxID=37326 RepID=UPI002456AF07
MSEPESITLEATRRRLSGKQADTVDKLTRSAVEVLAREGFAGMTIRMVAAAAGVGGPAPHNKINNKEHQRGRKIMG